MILDFISSVDSYCGINKFNKDFLVLKDKIISSFILYNKGSRILPLPFFLYKGIFVRKL